MASLSKDEKGFRIQVSINKKQRNIRWGKVAPSLAKEAQTNIEALTIALETNSTPPTATNKWVAGLGAKYHKRLAGYGLVEPREEEREYALSEFLDTYINSKKDLKLYSIRNMKNTRNKLVEFFKGETRITKLNDGSAVDFEQHLKNQKYSQATISKAIKHSKQFFSYAVKKKLINENPFQDIKPGSDSNVSRLQFIERDVINKVIAAATDLEFATIIALSRYAALRVPSEVLALRWSDLDFTTLRMTVTSPKTEKHDKGFRVVPIYPELRKYLEQLHDERKVGIETSISDFVITRYRDSNTNLRTRMEKTIRRAKVGPKWERLFHNLRASRITELCDDYPMHVVVDWCGNSETIALKHYLKTRPEHYQRAIGQTTDEHFIKSLAAKLKTVSTGMSLSELEKFYSKVESIIEMAGLLKQKAKG